MKDPNIAKNYKNYINKSVALIGHMGSGKTLIGKMIAKEFKILHIDSDKLISKKTKKTINQVFKDEGETEFRKIEEEVVLGLNSESRFVLSLGGGSIPCFCNCFILRLTTSSSSCRVIHSPFTTAII